MMQKPSDRAAVVSKLPKSVGGTLEAYYGMLGTVGWVRRGERSGRSLRGRREPRHQQHGRVRSSQPQAKRGGRLARMIDPAGRVSFDRAADYYDQTRALSPEALAGVVELLASELTGRGRCLEIGVGTGRIALPLAAAGQTMAGIDVSAAMLGRLIAKADGHAPFPVVLADATRLPFRQDTFGAALCVHVLHLIPHWKEAVDELLRVVRPRGVLLVDVGGNEDPTLKMLEDRFGVAAGITAAERPGLPRSRIAELDDRLAAAGCRRRLLPPVPVVGEERLAEHIDRLEEGLYSWTWPVAEATRRSAAAETRAWAVAEFGPLDAPRTVRSEVGHRAYDLPG